MTFKIRSTSPSTDNKYYKHTSAGGLNSCLKIGNGSVLPNCVGYAWGRWYEATGKKPNLSRGNAENWYSYSDGYKRGKTPKVGAVICWRQGQVGYGADGAGHVAFVEKVYANGDIKISQSGYGWVRFDTRRLTKKSNYHCWNGYVFQGFIYNPYIADSVSCVKYTVGKTYSLQMTMKVRKGHGENSKVLDTYNKGTKVKVLKVFKGTKRTWIKTAKGWICAKYNDDSTVYIK